jgi:small subunit ribosomal protein S4
MKTKSTTKVSEQKLKQARPSRKLSAYGRQLEEKQKVKLMYGVQERQFRRFFQMATKSQDAPGERLLSLLERRLDNVVYRLKFAVSRAQARQIIVHGHILVNGKKVYSPSYLCSVGDVISLAPNVSSKTEFVERVINKRLAMGVKVPDWIELNKQDFKGIILRLPVRADIQAPVQEHFIVELYSK